VSSKDDVREFLISRRANVAPAQVGLPDFGGERRVPGLRREEVALLAGVSVDYYTRLERGKIRGASPSVLDAIARALRLNDAEREYLFELADATPAAARRARTPAERTVRASVQRVLDHMTVPAIVYNATQDILVANLLGRALYSPHFEVEGTPNLARFIFLDPRARDFYVDWRQARLVTAAMMRLEAGRDPLNDDLTALIGELSTRSTQFRKDWAGHDVHQHNSGTKSFRHPQVGVIEIAYDVFEMPGQAGLQVVTYSAPAASESAEKFTLLAAWAATAENQKKQEHQEGQEQGHTAHRSKDAGGHT
jgi:PAS domain-containing protein